MTEYDSLWEYFAAWATKELRSNRDQIFGKVQPEVSTAIEELFLFCLARVRETTIDGWRQAKVNPSPQVEDILQQAALLHSWHNLVTLFGLAYSEVRRAQKRG